MIVEPAGRRRLTARRSVHTESGQIAGVLIGAGRLHTIAGLLRAGRIALAVDRGGAGAWIDAIALIGVGLFETIWVGSPGARHVRAFHTMLSAPHCALGMYHPEAEWRCRARIGRKSVPAARRCRFRDLKILVHPALVPIRQRRACSCPDGRCYSSAEERQSGVASGMVVIPGRVRAWQVIAG